MKALISQFCTGLVLFVSLGSAFVCIAEERTAEQWLKEMDRAVHELDYAGTMSYFDGSSLTTLRLVHVVVDDIEHERIIHLNGPHREIVRAGNRVSIFMEPDDVLVHLDGVLRTGTSGKILSDRLSDRIASLTNVYLFKVEDEARVADRPSVCLVLRPNDDNRYGFRFSIDKETALLLKFERNDEQGRSLEAFQFTELQVGNVPAELVQPVAGAQRLVSRVLNVHSFTNQQSGLTNKGSWYLQWVPIGFSMRHTAVNQGPAGRSTTRTWMYSDGMTAFSVYIETMPEVPVRETVLQNGATVVVTDRVAGPEGDEHLITVVGEVPVRTAQKIASSVVLFER